MLDGLDAIDWVRLTHAYGSAGDVPGHLRDLAAADPDVRQRARWCLYDTIIHRGARTEASAPAIPFLLELAADPAACERHELLHLVTHLVAGQLGVAADPRLYTGASDHRPDDDDAAILRAVYRAAERGEPLCFALLDDPAPELRSAAAYLLASLWTLAGRSVPALRARLVDEPRPEVRAVLAFALGRLLPPGPLPDAQLAHALVDDPSPLVRLLAAVGLVRLHGARAPEAAVDVLVAALADPSPLLAYEELPCGEHDLAGDIGAVVRELPPAFARRALPALRAALARAEDWDSVGLVAALLALSFGQDPHDMSSGTWTEDQLETLLAMVRCPAMWTIGEVAFMLRARGLPGDREALAARLGVTVPRDPAAEALAQGRFYLVRLGDPARAAAQFARAAALRPDDPEAWLQLAEAHLAGGRRDAARPAIDRALALAPDDGRAWFVRGQAILDDDAPAAAEAFARAAAGGFFPALSGCNEATALALAGRRDAAVAALAAVIADEPECAEAHHRLGLHRLEDGHAADAIASLTRALALRPDHAESHRARACALCLSGQLDAALADLARAVALAPDLRDALAGDPDLAALADRPAFQRLVRWDEPALTPATA